MELESFESFTHQRIAGNSKKGHDNAGKRVEMYWQLSYGEWEEDDEKWESSA